MGLCGNIEGYGSEPLFLFVDQFVKNQSAKNGLQKRIGFAMGRC